VQLVKKVRADELSNIFKKPKKDTGLNSLDCNFAYSPNVSHQADLLFLPDDKGYRYALVVTDIANRLSDVKPLKTKNSDEVAEHSIRFINEVFWSYRCLLKWMMAMNLKVK